LFKFLASQAKSIYAYKKLREKLQRCCANIYFNQQCLQLGVIPKYARIKIPFTYPASTTIQRKSQILRVKEGIKFLYSKKDKLNLLLCKAHLNAALERGNLWHLIQDNISQSTNSKFADVYKALDAKLTQLTHNPTDANRNKHVFFQRVTNLTSIDFTDEELFLLKKGLKYDLGHKRKNWIQNLSIEAECAITLLPQEEQEYMRHRVAIQIDKIYAQHT